MASAFPHRSSADRTLSSSSSSQNMWSVSHISDILVSYELWAMSYELSLPRRFPLNFSPITGPFNFLAQSLFTIHRLSHSPHFPSSRNNHTLPTYWHQLAIWKFHPTILYYFGGETKIQVTLPFVSLCFNMNVSWTTLLSPLPLSPKYSSVLYNPCFLLSSCLSLSLCVFLETFCLGTF